MNANKQDAVGLPELPAPNFMLRWDSMRAAYYVSRPNVGNTDVYTADQMRAYGELCRAAPAGGDVCKTCQGHGMIGWTTGQTPEQFDQHEAPCPDCSAPAGSGEVEEMAQRLEERAKWFRDGNDDATLLRTAAALLRKLQQGAEYSPNSVAKRKRVEIEALGYVCNGVSFMHPETGRRGLLDDLGAVHWIASQGQDGGTNG